MIVTIFSFNTEVDTRVMRLITKTLVRLGLGVSSWPTVSNHPGTPSYLDLFLKVLTLDPFLHASRPLD